jgi:hypothetical protein
MHTRTSTLTAAGAATIALTLTLGGCSLLGNDDAPLPKPTSTSADRRAQTSQTDDDSPSPTPTPTTPPIPEGTVGAEADVVSPSGETAVHVKVVANGADGWDVELSGYRSTIDQPMSIEFRRTVPKPTDGYGSPVGQVYGWESGAPKPEYSLDLTDSYPIYVRSVVLIPRATDAQYAAQQAPSWVDHVLAVAPLTWNVTSPYPDLHVTETKAVPGAYGTVTERDGAPWSYLVAHGDEARSVAKRFGITVPELEWLNPVTSRDDHWLFEGTTLNLSPAGR